MADDKPRHKPQAKRTLEEVLRSLKDLVRNDLTGGRASPAPPPAARHPVAPDEPESFNEALSRLDAIIDEKIVNPARTAPPAGPPPTADEIDIDWDEVAPPANANGGGHRPAATAASDLPASGADDTDLGPTALDDDAADAEYRAERLPDEGAGMPDADAAALAALEAIELAPMAPQAPQPDESSGGQEPREQASGLQETFSFLEAEGQPHTDGQAPAPEESALYVALDAQSAAVQAEVADARDADPVAPARRERAAEDGDRVRTAETAPEPGDTNDAKFESDRAERQALAMSADWGDNGEAANRPGAGARDAGRVSGDARRDPTAEPGRNGDPAAPGTNEPPTLDAEIPLLQDVAPGQTAASAPLPDAAHARDIAIRVIARINIERRKSGETPLDIRTIERLQRYLTEALTKAATGRK